MPYRVALRKHVINPTASLNLPHLNVTEATVTVTGINLLLLLFSSKSYFFSNTVGKDELTSEAIIKDRMKLK